MKSEEAVIMALFFMFTEEFLEWIGLDVHSSYLLSILIVPIFYVLERYNLWIMRKAFVERLNKPIILFLGHRGLYQEVRVKVRTASDIMLNLAGSLLPVLLSFIALYYCLFILNVSLLYYSALVAFLVVVYNRVSRLVKGVGLGIPFISVLMITIFASLSIALEENYSASTASLMTFSASAIAALLGIDLLNIKVATIFKSRYLIIGGMGLTDALLFLPALSSLLISCILSS